MLVGVLFMACCRGGDGVRGGDRDKLESADQKNVPVKVLAGTQSNKGIRVGQCRKDTDPKHPQR